MPWERRSNGETAFEQAILKRLPHCEVHVFDPTLHEDLRRKVDAIEGIKFHGYGLGGKDERVSPKCSLPMPPQGELFCCTL